jgi:hypothetical protein
LQSISDSIYFVCKLITQNSLHVIF